MTQALPWCRDAGGGLSFDAATTNVATVVLWGSIGVVAATAFIALRLRSGSIEGAFSAHQIATNFSIFWTLTAGFALGQAFFGIAASMAVAAGVFVVAAVMWMRTRRHRS